MNPDPELRTSRAVVLTRPGRLDLQVLPRPAIGDDDALLRIEASGLCGTDVDYFDGAVAPGPGQPDDFRYPFVLGHEPVGRIEEIGAAAARRWGVKVGDRVTANYWTCGTCAACRAGRQDRCDRPRAGIGRTTTSVAPGLWGSWADLLYLPPQASVARFSMDLDAPVAALYNAFGGAWAWTVERAGLRPGQSVAIIGPGQRGLAAILAAHDHGADLVVMVGRGRHPHKLDLARRLGADLVIDADVDDPRQRVLDATGDGVDVVVDLAPDPTTFALGLTLLRRNGTFVSASAKRGRPLTDWCPDVILERGLTVIGAYGQSDRAKHEGIRLVEGYAELVAPMVTHVFPLEQAEEAIDTLAGRRPDRRAVNVMLVP